MREQASGTDTGIRTDIGIGSCMAFDIDTGMSTQEPGFDTGTGIGIRTDIDTDRSTGWRTAWHRE
jgi:hypothetical protein